MPAAHSWLRKQLALQQVRLQPEQCQQYMVQLSTAQRLIRYMDQLQSATGCHRARIQKSTDQQSQLGWPQPILDQLV